MKRIYPYSDTTTHPSVSIQTEHQLHIPDICVNITRYLGAISLCSLSCVSKKLYSRIFEIFPIPNPLEPSRILKHPIFRFPLREYTFDQHITQQDPIDYLVKIKLPTEASLLKLLSILENIALHSIQHTFLKFIVSIDAQNLPFRRQINNNTFIHFHAKCCELLKNLQEFVCHTDLDPNNLPHPDPESTSEDYL